MRPASRRVMPLLLLLCPAAPAQVAQLAELYDSRVGVQDAFGIGAGFDGVTIVVSAPYDAQTYPLVGCAYVFQELSGTWTSVARLAPDNPWPSETFGWDVAVDGDIIVAGRPYNYDAGAEAGSAAVFERVAGVWTQTADLHASDASPHALFGISVDVDEAAQRIVVSSYSDTTDGMNVGGVYVFERAGGGTWQEVARVHPQTSNGHRFQMGSLVRLDGERIAVGGALSDTQGVTESGSVSIVERIAGQWLHTDTITPPTPGPRAQFGTVALSGDSLLVGAAGEPINGLNSAGAAYFYEYSGGGWTLSQRVEGAPVEGSAKFGAVTDLQGDVAVISATAQDVAGNNSGGAYLYARRQGQWQLREIFVGEDTNGGDGFGRAIAIAGDRAVIGAPFENRLGIWTGTAYVFEGLWDDCPADLDGDGDADGDDFFGYLDLFAADDPDADLDGDGDRDADDFFVYLDRFASGC
ncbi:MAG: FG-GAP repeat protein [Phycisphaeraceae bacterium]|nr:FG-GAP repeat protein [Phycisphaeraceae bacterium]